MIAIIFKVWKYEMKVKRQLSDKNRITALCQQFNCVRGKMNAKLIL